MQVGHIICRNNTAAMSKVYLKITVMKAGFKQELPKENLFEHFGTKGSQPFSTYLSFLVASSQVPSGGVKRLGSPRLSSPSRHLWQVVSAYTRG